MKNKVELLAPAGNMEKLKTAIHFGADAVYLAGKDFGLRAYADNFTHEEMKEAVQYAHSKGVKVYVTLNIFAKNQDFEELKDYLHQLEIAKVDAVLVTDFGVFNFVKQNSNLNIHISTQANTTNKYSAKSYYELGAERVVLARELSLAEIVEIKQFVPELQLETFVHGAMCISYSGRCLMSNYLTDRDSNRGECVQSCRWKWKITEVDNDERELLLEEDKRGAYIFNSKDLNMIHYINELIEAGIDSLKIEGRMKSPFYVATVVNAYRTAIDNYYNGITDDSIYSELNKASHREYTTGFFKEDLNRQNYQSSRAVEESKFIAKVISSKNGFVTVEQRNKFCDGDTLEILSNNKSSFNKTFVAENIVDEKGNSVTVCNQVQQILTMPCDYQLSAGDILRAPQNNSK